ncbi:unnamed protein product, partial [Prorocentrum cordatum]
VWKRLLQLRARSRSPSRAREGGPNVRHLQKKVKEGVRSEVIDVALKMLEDGSAPTR